ncbi:MAG TPA: nucleotidyltransferase family protein [Terracidiphilus sp.]|nr:nucleotidyltransferase family protein [Terracidiphilus sp.]
MRTHLVGNGSVRARVPTSFAAVMQALQLRHADATQLHRLHDDDWKQLLPILDRARLTLPLAQQPHSGFPKWVHERLSSNLADTAQHWEHVKTAYREAAAALGAKSLEYLVLKGFTQAPDFVPRPELRRQSDIDFYVPPDQISSAVVCLQEIGYAPCHTEDVYQYADHVPTLVRFGTWKWRGNWYDPDTPPAIEVHFCLWNESISSIAFPEAGDFWNRRRVRACEDLIFPALHQVDHLAYFALHILRDIFNEDSRANQVRELGTFLDRRANADAFWDDWTAIHSPRSRSMQATVFALAVAWFSCNVSETVEAEIDSLPAKVGAWIKRCGCTPLEAQFRRTRDGRLLQFLLAETPEARKWILWKALVPSRLPGPEKVASRRIHPSLRAAPKVIFSCLAYPAHMVSRFWMNGDAVFRFLANACLVHTSRAWARMGSRRDLRNAPAG